MFPTEYLHYNEVVCQYEGTVRRITATEIANLKMQHEHEENRIIELHIGIGIQYQWMQ